MAQTKRGFCHLMLHVFRAKPYNILPRRQHLRIGDILHRSIYEQLRGAADVRLCPPEMHSPGRVPICFNGANSARRQWTRQPRGAFALWYFMYRTTQPQPSDSHSSEFLMYSVPRPWTLIGSKRTYRTSDCGGNKVVPPTVLTR